MATRGTKTAGVQGPEHAIGVATALELYTTGTARLNGEADRLGSITPPPETHRDQVRFTQTAGFRAQRPCGPCCLFWLQVASGGSGDL